LIYSYNFYIILVF